MTCSYPECTGDLRLLRRLPLRPVYLTILFHALVLIPALLAEDWPQWRGPSGNGISSGVGLPSHWSPTENIKWKSSLAGLGASSPIVFGDRIFVTSQKGVVPISKGMQPQLARDDQSLASQENPIGGRNMQKDNSKGEVTLIVEAFHRSDGHQLWKYSMPATGEFPQLHEKHNLATPTPVTDGKLVYAWFGTGQLIALDMSGKLVWSRHLGTEYSPFQIPWGHGGSPILYKESIILLCDHPNKSFLLALDKGSGKERWNVTRGEGRISHSTPLVVPGSERDELIINSSERVDAYNPENGEFLWSFGSQRQTPVPSPVFNNGVIYLSRGYRNSDFLAVKSGGHGDVSKSSVLWNSSSGASYVPSILYYEGLLYITNEVGIVTCADAETGKPVWKERLGGIFFASPTAGDGKIYMVSETGETYVLKAGRQARILAKNDLGERFLASPAFSDNQLFLRSDTTLFCISSGSDHANQ
jgi:outer membrane protein assembly factor BamB